MCGSEWRKGAVIRSVYCAVGKKRLLTKYINENELYNCNRRKGIN